MKNKIKKHIKTNYKKILFFSFLIFYFILGFLLSYNYNLNEKYDFIFEADIPRIIEDCSQIFGNHYRISVHPLYVLISQPIILILKGICYNDILSIILFQSIVGSLQVIIMYESIYMINKNKKISLLISIMFGLSLSNGIFSSIPELYTLAALGLQITWLATIKKINNKIDNKKFNILYIISGVLCLGITITNYIVFLITSFILLLSEKINLKKIIVLNLITVSLFISLNYCQKLIWHSVPTILFNEKITEEGSASWVDFSVNINKIKNVVSDDYYNSLIGSDVYYEKKTNHNETLIFHKINKYNLLLITIFYLLLIVSILKKFKTNFIINLGLVLSLAFNTIFHIIYGNASTFLYSQHFVYLFFLLLGINISKIESKKTKNILILFFTIFIISQIFINAKVFTNIIANASEIFKNNYFTTIKTTYVIIGLLLLYLSIFIFKIIIEKIMKYINLKTKYNNIIILALTLIYISIIFISIETAKGYGYFWDYPLENIKKLEIDTKDYKVFSNKFPNEIKEFKKYIKEYKSFIKKSNAKTVTVNYDKNIYLFGFNNRKKILYKEGKLIDLESKKTLYKYDIKNELIIPNIYTVLIEQNNGDFVRIYESEEGIIIRDSTKKILDDKKINLPNLDNLKYSTILKTLYGELLFNIKNGVIYPNIIVYNNPWYRDAALSAMVLEYTNNTDLIKEWINNLTNIYDMQNNNIKETDNLGELLYLISLTGNKDNKIIDEIIEEANKIMKSNKDGYFLTGQTDFQTREFYPSSWYNFGLKKLGLEENIDINKIKNLDSYSSTTWWYNNKCNYGHLETTNKKYPYLGYAQNHCTKKTKIYLNNNLYPLSWEEKASQANYNKMEIIDDIFKENKISLTHSWSAAELFMLIIDNYN